MERFLTRNGAKRKIDLSFPVLTASMLSMVLYAAAQFIPPAKRAPSPVRAEVTARIVRSAEASQQSADKHAPDRKRILVEKQADGRERIIVVLDFE